MGEKPEEYGFTNHCYDTDLTPLSRVKPFLIQNTSGKSCKQAKVKMKENLHQIGKIMDTLPEFPFLF